MVRPPRQSLHRKSIASGQRVADRKDGRCALNREWLLAAKTPKTLANRHALQSQAARFSRFPSYQRCSFTREQATLRPPTMTPKTLPRICLAEYMRSFRPEVRIGSRSTLKRPSFLRARLK